MTKENTQNVIEHIMQQINDFKFKRYLIIIMEIAILTMIATFRNHILLIIVPYTCYLAIVCLTVGITGSMKKVSSVSQKFNLIIIAALLIEMPVKYSN
jgi:hypothetical protein